MRAWVCLKICDVPKRTYKHGSRLDTIRRTNAGSQWQKPIPCKLIRSIFFLFQRHARVKAAGRACIGIFENFKDASQGSKEHNTSIRAFVPGACKKEAGPHMCRLGGLLLQMCFDLYRVPDCWWYIVHDDWYSVLELVLCFGNHRRAMPNVRKLRAPFQRQGDWIPS